MELDHSVHAHETRLIRIHRHVCTSRKEVAMGPVGILQLQRVGWRVGDASAIRQSLRGLEVGPSGQRRRTTGERLGRGFAVRHGIMSHGVKRVRVLP